MLHHDLKAQELATISLKQIAGAQYPVVEQINQNFSWFIGDKRCIFVHGLVIAMTGHVLFIVTKICIVILVANF